MSALRLHAPRYASLAQSVGLALGCFLFAAILDGSRPGEAAVAATAVAGSVGPGGSSSLAGELGSALTPVRFLVGSIARRIGVR